MPSIERKMRGAQLSVELIERVDNYLRSPVAIASSKRELFEIAIGQLLDREEIIAAKLEKELEKENNRLRALLRL
jgi:hypothetical protein